MERANYFYPGLEVEVEGRPMEVLAGRRVSCSGGDWLPATLSSIETRQNGGKYVNVLHHDVYEDEEGTKRLLETISVRFVRPAQPHDMDHDTNFHPVEGDIVDARLPDVEGESGIWWVATVVDVNKLRGYQVARPESGEKYWVQIDKLRPTKTWLSGDIWVSSNSNYQPSFSRMYSDSNVSEKIKRERALGIIKTDSSLYIGDHVDGCKDGWGIEINQDYSRYEGKFKAGLRHGLGICQMDQSRTGLANSESLFEVATFFCEGESCCDIYHGQFCDSNFGGFGVYSYAMGDSCAGAFKSNQLHGLGGYYWANAGSFAGNWSESQAKSSISVKSGLGVRKSVEGTYEGSWSEDYPHGPGIMKFPNDDRYEGEWTKGTITGCGMMFRSHGRVYTGDFVKGEQDGYGILVNGDVTYEGGWKRSRKHGYIREKKMVSGIMKAVVSLWSDGRIQKQFENPPEDAFTSLQEVQISAKRGREAAERAVEFRELAVQWRNQAEEAAASAFRYKDQCRRMRYSVLETMSRQDIGQIVCLGEKDEVKTNLFFGENFLYLARNVLCPKDGKENLIDDLTKSMEHLLKLYHQKPVDDFHLKESGGSLIQAINIFLDLSLSKKTVPSEYLERIKILQNCLRLLFQMQHMVPESNAQKEKDQEWNTKWKNIHNRLISLKSEMDIDIDNLPLSNPSEIDTFIQEIMDSLSVFDGHLEKLIAQPPSVLTFTSDEVSDLKSSFQRYRDNVITEYVRASNEFEQSQQQENELFNQIANITKECATLFTATSTSNSPASAAKRETTMGIFFKHFQSMQEMKSQMEQLQTKSKKIAVQNEMMQHGTAVLNEVSHFSDNFFQCLSWMFARNAFPLVEKTFPVEWFLTCIQCENHLFVIYYETLKFYLLQIRGKLDEVSSLKNLLTLGGSIQKEEIYSMELKIETIRNQWSNIKKRVSEGFKNVNWILIVIRKMKTTSHADALVKHPKKEDNATQDLNLIIAKSDDLMKKHVQFNELCMQWDTLFPMPSHYYTERKQSFGNLDLLTENTKNVNEGHLQRPAKNPTFVITHKDCNLHESAPGGYEKPERLVAIMRGLEAIKREDFNVCIIDDIAKISSKHILAVHSEDYVRKIHEKSRNIDSLSHKTPLSGICGDTFLGKHSLSAAYYAASAVCAAVDRVIREECRNAFVAVRPPGHHAGVNGVEESARKLKCGQGFCILNNVAIGVRHAMDQHENIRKVAIIDIDVHHGNGTEEIFEKDDTVLFASIHQAFQTEDGLNEYPGTGMTLKTDGLNITIPIDPKKSNRKDYMEQFDKFIVPAIHNFRPDLIMLSSGFDAHEDDIIGHLWLNTNDYIKLTKKIMQLADLHCHGRLVSVLEGGYNVHVLEKVTRLHVQTLATNWSDEMKDLNSSRKSSSGGLSVEEINGATQGATRRNTRSVNASAIASLRVHNDDEGAASSVDVTSYPIRSPSSMNMRSTLKRKPVPEQGHHAKSIPAFNASLPSSKMGSTSSSKKSRSSSVETVLPDDVVNL